MGTNVLTDNRGFIDRTFIDDISAQVARLQREGFEPIIVTSGAIAAGLESLNLDKRPTDIPSLQAAASVGQAFLTEMYAESFRKHGLQTGLILITRGDTSNRNAYLHARDTFERLIELKAIPIVNENDTIAVDEIRFGDNDTLAALIALMIDASKVIMLTDIDGLYTADPRKDPNAVLIDEVCEVSDELVSYASGAGTHLGTGGMITKLRAAKMLLSADIEMTLTAGRQADVLIRALNEELKATYFRVGGSCSLLNHKKRWIAFGSIPQAEVVIDEGAVRALRKGGVSLLSPGVKEIRGEFEEGSLVSIASESGEIVARGITSLDSKEVYTSEKHLLVHCDALALL